MKRGPKPRCPYCGSRLTIRKGCRVTRTIGRRPLALCRSCGRKFTVGRPPVLHVVAHQAGCASDDVECARWPDSM